MIVRKYKSNDIDAMVDIWNEVVSEGIAFPQEDILNIEEANKFFECQTYCGVAENKSGEIVGLYILHPNNVGRCGHICNASYAVLYKFRGQHIGEKLVKDCIKKAAENGYGILQFNAVVKSNIGALHLYKKLGFKSIGEIPNGFRMKDGSYEAIIPHYIEL